MNFLKENQNKKTFIGVSLLSLGGIPPLLGFFRKIIVLNIISLNGYFLTVLLIIIATLISLY
jgi:NADH:ubiquinone oxidoreductase subunit 2 (subunit N)